MEDERNGDRMSRRTVIGAAAASLAAGGASAQAPQPHVKGPRVWLDFDQQELDDAYDQSKYAPNRDQMNRRRAVAAYFGGLAAILVANAIRITLLFVLGNTRLRIQVIEYHLTAGWILFTLAFIEIGRAHV